MASKNKSQSRNTSSLTQPVHLSEDDLRRIISEAKKRPRWYDLGAFAAVISLAAFLLYQASASSTEIVSSKLDSTSKEIIERLASLEQDTQKYDPIFRNTLLAQTRAVLHSVRVTDIENQAIQARLEEIIVSLDRSGTFRDSGQGWLKLLTLLVKDIPETIEPVPYTGKSYRERQDILRSWTPIGYADNEIGIIEQCYLDTFSALLQLKELRSSTVPEAGSVSDLAPTATNLSPSIEESATAKAISEVFERLARVTRMCPDLPNAHNGLGVYWLEIGTQTGNSAQFDVAQTHFTYAYHLGIFNSADRGAVLGTFMNNVASLKLTRAYMSSLPNRQVGGYWYFTKLPDRSRLISASDDLQRSLFEMESTEDITVSTAINLLTKAELNMVLALLERALMQPDLPISFDSQEPKLALAIEYLKQARYRGFEDWCYFFSRDWTKLTILATPGLSEQISDWCAF